MKLSYLLVCYALLIVMAPTNAQNRTSSPYAGQEIREIKSLSVDDVQELRRGGGWGLAKAAELNGMPGPLHVLEAKTELALEDTQIEAITEIFMQMKARAIEQGERLIGLERVLEKHFRNRTMTDQILRSTLNAIGEARTELRYIHLSAHLATPELLSREQVEQYNALRGYFVTDPCDNAPDGHNADLWRRHNGCD